MQRNREGMDPLPFLLSDQDRYGYQNGVQKYTKWTELAVAGTALLLTFDVKPVKGSPGE